MQETAETVVIKLQEAQQVCIKFYSVTQPLTSSSANIH